mgnify:CR=1 FL=1
MCVALMQYQRGQQSEGSACPLAGLHDDQLCRASRTWGRIVSVRPCDLTDIDHAEAVREGFDSVPECLAGIRAIYPDTPVFWRIEWERIEVPNG